MVLIKIFSLYTTNMSLANSLQRICLLKMLVVMNTGFTLCTVPRTFSKNMLRALMPFTTGGFLKRIWSGCVFQNVLPVEKLFFQFRFRTTPSLNGSLSRSYCLHTLLVGGFLGSEGTKRIERGRLCHVQNSTSTPSIGTNA